MTYYNLKGKVFTEPEIGQWYNLGTRRVVTKKPKQDDYILYDTPRITGTTKMIQDFFEIQKSKGLQKSNEIQKVPKRRKEKEIQKVPKRRKEKEIQKVSDASSSVYYPSSTDICDIPTDQLNCLCEFSLEGLKVKARVLEIIDGDTIDIVFFINLDQMNSPREKICKSKAKVVRSIIGFPEDRGFFSRMRVRIAEIDTAEKRTNKGKIAKTLLQVRINHLNRIVYADFIKFEKYGRLLANIFEDEARTINIKSPLLEFSHPILGPVAVPYSGGKKIPWPATPPRFELESEYK